MKFKEGDKFYCIMNKYRGDTILFEKDVRYEFICMEQLDIADGRLHQNYILDRIDNGAREIFYNIETFSAYFISMKELRKLKLDEIESR